MRGLGADTQYWQALAAGRLEMQQCAACTRWHWPAVWRCGECGSWEHHWREVPLAGRIFTWTRTWHDFIAAKEFVLPFISVVVELNGAGQRRLMGTLEGAAQDVRIGANVTGSIAEVALDGGKLPVLRWRMTASS